MRDITENAIRFSWSLSLFGIQQMVNLLSPSKAAETFDRASRAMERQLEGGLRNAFDAGVDLQDRVSDLAFGEGLRDAGLPLPGQSGGGPGGGGNASPSGPSPGKPRPAAVPPRGASPPPSGVPSGAGAAPASSPIAPSSTTQPGTTGSSAAGSSAAGSSAAGSSAAGSSAAGSSTVSPRVEGWGPIPYPVVPPSTTQAPPAGASGQASPPVAGPTSSTAAVSGEYPFEDHYVEVHGSRMHYVDVGEGDPILLLHGNPTWSYVWRNIIPHLEPLGRCIAPDLIGFGRSDKPESDYLWSDHVRYLEGFIEKMGLKNVRLVLHDQGSNLGLHYASRHASNIKALACFEAILRPYPWDEFSTPEFRELFRKFRTGDVGGEGWQMIVEQNMFIEALLPQASGRPLSDLEMSYYREPFPTPESRVPIWRWPKQTPIGGEPEEVWQAVSAYSRWLQSSPLPKLLLYASPGALITAEQLAWAKANIRSLETVSLGAGSHFLQESSPHQIGQEIAAWFRTLDEKPALEKKGECCG